MKRFYFEFAGAKLTLREACIVSLMVQGYRGKQVSNLLGKSFNTVKHQLLKIYEKTGKHNCELLVKLAKRKGFDRRGFFRKVNLFATVTLCSLPKGADVKVEGK